MKGSRALWMLMLSVISGLAAVVLAARWLNQQAEPVTAELVVVRRDVGMGEALSVPMLERVPWGSAWLPRGAVRDLASLEGRVVTTAMARGEPVLESRLAPIGARAGLSALIPEGRRAITVKVNEVVGVAGFALPGNHVDVMVNTQDARQDPVSKIVLERILVLAVAQEASRDEARPKVVNAVTLEVTPEQAERLDLARSVGTLALVLRNQVDQVSVVTSGIRKADLLRETPMAAVNVVAAMPPAAAQERPKRVVRPLRSADRRPVVEPAPEMAAGIEVIRGVQRSHAAR